VLQHIYYTTFSFFSYLIGEVGKVCWYCCLNQDYCTILWLWMCFEQWGHENWWQKPCPSNTSDTINHT